MNINEIKELLLTINKTNLTYVNLKDKDFSLEVSKTKDNLIDNTKEVQLCEIETNTFEVSSSQIDKNEDLHLIKAPIMGTYYDSATPEASSFVKVGDTVSAGDTLCIIEAMKLMNEITSDVNGEVVEVLALNEELVEYNQVLFKIKTI